MWLRRDFFLWKSGNFRIRDISLLVLLSFSWASISYLKICWVLIYRNTGNNSIYDTYCQQSAVKSDHMRILFDTSQTVSERNLGNFWSMFLCYNLSDMDNSLFLLQCTVKHFQSQIFLLNPLTTRIYANSYRENNPACF